MAMMIPLLYSLTVCMSFVGVDSLNVDTFIKGEFVEINIKNDGTNTVFLFDEYFDNSTLTSRYVHQYEKKASLNICHYSQCFLIYQRSSRTVW